VLREVGGRFRIGRSVRFFVWPSAGPVEKLDGIGCDAGRCASVDEEARDAASGVTSRDHDPLDGVELGVVALFIIVVVVLAENLVICDRSSARSPSHIFLRRLEQIRGRFGLPWCQRELANELDRLVLTSHEAAPSRGVRVFDWY
jgi:hypothetical protein